MKHKTRTWLASAGIASLLLTAPALAAGSDLTVFEEALNDDPGIEVRLREWYPGS